MDISIERNRQGITDKMVFKSDDKINLHFKLPDGEIISFEDVPFDVLMSNVQAYRSNGVNGRAHNLFVEDEDDDRFDELEELS